MISIRHKFTVLKLFVKGADLMEVVWCMVQAVWECEGGSQFNMERNLFRQCRFMRVRQHEMSCEHDRKLSRMMV